MALGVIHHIEDYEIDLVSIRSLSVTATKRLAKALSHLDGPTNLHGDYRDLGEALLDMRMHDVKLLETQFGSQGYSSRIVERWLIHEPRACIGTLRRVLTDIGRHDVEYDVTEVIRSACEEQHKALTRSRATRKDRRGPKRDKSENRISEIFIPMEANKEPCPATSAPTDNECSTFNAGHQQETVIPKNCIRVTDAELRKTLRILIKAYSPRIYARLIFYCQLLVVALVGILETVHLLLRSTFYDPIDYSAWSIYFFVVSLGKEASMYILMFTLPVTVGMQYATVHVYLMVLVLAQIVQDKTVSAAAKEMRQYYIHMLCLYGMNSDDLQNHCRLEAEHRQRTIQQYLQLFLAVQSVLLTLLLIQTNTAAWHLIHEAVYYWCLVAYFGKVVVYVRHYRYTNADLLQGRFNIDVKIPTKPRSGPSLVHTV